ncbi:GNAT family N-acetyltransferase [Labrys neptuniae]
MILDNHAAADGHLSPPRSEGAAAPPVRRAEARDIERLASCDFSFLIAETAVEPYDGPKLGRTLPVTPSYRKSYGFDGEDLAGYLDDDDSTLLVAEAADGRPVAYVALSRGWNNYAVIEDIAVDAAHRGGGVAKRLMDKALAWATNQKLAGVRLETQSNNVGACRFYERYGFVLAGYDRHLYQGLNPGTEEVALFWYYLFRDEE